MEALREMKDKEYDLAIIDPPYGIGWTNTINYKTEKRRDSQRKRGYKTHIPKNWDSCRPTKEYFKELRRVSKNQIIWGGNYFANILPLSRCWLIWDKMVNFSAVSNEMAWTSFNNKINIFSRHHGLDKGFLNTEGHIHPTQKPVKLYEWLLHNYAKEGDKILDTHLGSGSSAIACYNMGFSLDGFEIDKDYYEGAVKRLEIHKRQQVLFLPNEIFANNKQTL